MSVKLWDSAPQAIRDNMVRDVQAMAKHECGRSISAYDAQRIVRKVLAGAHERDALYRVSTAWLCKLMPR